MDLFLILVDNNSVSNYLRVFNSMDFNILDLFFTKPNDYIPIILNNNCHYH